MCAHDEDFSIELFKSKSFFHTGRLILRVPEAGDAPDIARLANDRRIVDMTSRMPYPYRLEDAVEWIEKCATPGLDESTFALIEKTSGKFIGACGFGATGDGPEIHIGYWIGVPFWGQGYATEAAHAVIDCAFSVDGIDELIGACRVTNPASRRVLQKCGFQYRDNGLSPSRALGGSVPVERFVLERDIWAALRRW